MSQTDDPTTPDPERPDVKTLRRFLRTLQVTTQTALAEYDLVRRHGVMRTVSTVRALAAQGRESWSFPRDGVASADGLLLATLSRRPDGTPDTLVLQAQGAAGLAAFAGQDAVVAFGETAAPASRFDQDGRLAAPLAGLGLAEDRLASFDIRMADETLQGDIGGEPPEGAADDAP